MRFVTLALMLAAAVSAQVSAPLVGWLPDGTQIRPINGLAAAAILGRPVNVGRAMTHIAVSPSQNYVLGSDFATGEVLFVVPGVSSTALNTSLKPDQIVVSPRGSSAILWFSAASQFEVLSGLPAAPAIRQISASFLSTTLNTPFSAIAVSDDGQWIAAASSTGVYEWGPDGASHQLYGGSDARAIAFFTGNSDLAIATSTQLLSIAGSASSVLYQSAFSPVGMAISFDNQKIVFADQGGTIYSVDAASRTPSIVDCQCLPSGVFGLGGAVFRLTSSTIGAVKLFDAAAGAILAVPGDGPKITRRVVRPAQTTAPLPTLTINLNPTPTGYLQQPAMTITASSAYPSEIDGNVALTFTSNSTTGGTDQTIQFSTGGATVNFTIPAGSRQANFSGAPSVSFSTGTVAGTTTLTANLTAPTSASAVATQTVTTHPTFPTITGVKLNQTSAGITVIITGYSPTDEVVGAVFLFALSSNASITTNDIGVSVSSEFQPYYANASSYATGSEFTLSVPFGVTGNPADLVGVTVTLVNSIAVSNPVSSQ